MVNQMHMRMKKWARPELEACTFFTETPFEYKGKWATCFSKKQSLHVELGCGKGVSTAKMVHEHQENNYIAIDITCNILGDTRRNIVTEFGNEPINNVMIARWDITKISEMLSPEDKVERLYISFPNPWTQRANKTAKRRLTHPRQLMQYHDFLTENGEIYFKTDNAALFLDSQDYLKKCGFEIEFLTNDLHASGFQPNYITEHEEMYTKRGIPTLFLIARKRSFSKDEKEFHDAIITEISNGGKESDRVLSRMNKGNMEK